MKIKNLRERENFKNVLEFYGIPVSGTKKVKYNNDYFTGDENDVEFAYKLLNLKLDDTRKDNSLNGMVLIINCLFFLDHDSSDNATNFIKKTTKWDFIKLIDGDNHFSLNKIKEYCDIYFNEDDSNQKPIWLNNNFFNSATWAINHDVYNFTGRRLIQSIQKMGRSFFLKYHFINDIELSLDDFYCEYLGMSMKTLRKQYYSIKKEIVELKEKKNTIMNINDDNKYSNCCIFPSVKILTSHGFKSITEINSNEIERYRMIEGKLKESKKY